MKSVELPDLPYPKDALLPHISKETMSYHYDKHHAGYVRKLNAALDDVSYTADNLMALIHQAWEEKDWGVFNNAAQVWNHTFFWNSMAPDKQPGDEARLSHMVDEFGGWDVLRDRFIDVGIGWFGSGWVWIVVTPDGKLDIVGTPNAIPPQIDGLRPILTCDVWEHAYYLDYQNDRAAFLSAFIDELANWTFAAGNLRKGGEGDTAAGHAYRQTQEDFPRSGPRQ